jgi:FkbM family methyltransferase
MRFPPWKSKIAVPAAESDSRSVAQDLAADLLKALSLQRRGHSHTLFDLGALRHRPRAENEAVVRSLCHHAYLGEGSALCRALGRYKMFVDTRDVGFSSHIMLDGYWEMWVTEAIAQLVHPGMVVADIGANLGYFTLLLADLVGPEGRVHAFEPNPRMTERLARSLDVNGFLARTAIHNVALGAADGEKMVFVVPPSEPKNAYLRPCPDETAGDGDGDIVETRRLDSRGDWAAIDFAKIDVEGAEELVWAGAAGLLEAERLRTVILEFTPGRYGDAGAFLDRILAPGFSLKVISPTRGIVAASREAVLGGDPAEDVMLLLQR